MTGEVRAPGDLRLEPSERYEVLGLLGRGGMGVVYKVHDRELDEVIAVKVLEPQDETPLSRERFKLEIKLARRINHPNVARVFDLITWNGRLAISQELIVGQSLTRHMGMVPVPLAEICRLLRYLCSALDAAHALGIVHRDLKPGNVLIDLEGRPHIVDFGTAMLAGKPSMDEADTIYGTPEYLAPEMILNPESTDPRTDIYSLGVLIYRLATGRLPFPAEKSADLILAHLETPPPPLRSVLPDVSQALQDVTLRCLAKNPRLRYATAGELFRDLEQRLAHEHRGVAPPIAVPPTLRGKVLVVDDDEDMRAWMKAILRACGCVMLEAPDGRLGIETALAEQPDLVLLDILMPMLDGRDVLRILKSNPKTADIPVVMVTSLTDEEEALFSRESGAAAFLNKPVQRDVLELLVEHFLGRDTRHIAAGERAPRVNTGPP